MCLANCPSIQQMQNIFYVAFPYDKSPVAKQPGAPFGRSWGYDTKATASLPPWLSFPYVKLVKGRSLGMIPVRNVRSVGILRHCLRRVLRDNTIENIDRAQPVVLHVRTDFSRLRLP
jgi:hypothetical protein